MIRSKEDFIEYIKANQLANKKLGKRLRIFHIIGFGETIWVFLSLRRRLEYIKNCKSGLLWKIYFRVLYYMFTRQSIRLGFSIPINTLGKGICIPHRGTVFINSKAKIGDYCKLHVCTNIGGHDGGVPVIGDRVYIGPGAKIFGDIVIANDIVVGANAVVNKSFSEPGITIGGIPAKKISDKNSAGMISYEQ